ncbi:hypothetical protein POM88_049145 [Heracleum sosnowskyi]|uniref:Uncharacterized protein n=1 Tax=Heracleum sosnowskyi TaxID=360622 RepID=A0AAD8GXC9_9APIA|nr:hypothetical protein POM88_049145 [Heracleum sosnowskyi]
MDQSVIFYFNGDDDDVGWGKNLGVVDNGDEVDDGKWLQEIIECFEKKCDEYNDGFLVTSDVKESSKEIGKECEDDDDDCVILDGDPDKASGEGENVAVGDDSEELVVVGETGQVACRDYPHSRDLCAKFPFTSTPHEQYCNQCHCYVCDAPAPCLKWGTGISISDHCHATGREDFWNLQRKSVKESHQSTAPVPRVLSTSMLTQQIQTNQAPVSTPLIQYNLPPTQVPVPATIPSMQYQTPRTQVPRPAPNTYIQYQAFQAQTPRQPLIQPSRTAAMNMPSTRGQSYVVPRNNLQQNLALLQSRNTGNNALARNRSHNVGSLGPRVNVPPTAMFKRRGTPVVASASNYKTGHLINGHGSTIHTRVPNAVIAPGNCNNMISAQKNGNSSMSQPSLQPYMQLMPSNIMAFQSQLQPRLLSESTAATTSLNRVPTQPMLSAQSNTGNLFVYSTTSPQIPYQNAHVGVLSSRTVSPQPQLSLQATNSLAITAPTEPPLSSPPSHASNNQQNVFQQQNQTNKFGDTSISEIGLNWLANTTNPSSQQTQAQNSQLPVSKSLPIGEFGFSFSGSSNTGSFDLNLEPWVLNNEELARLSSESASATVDVGSLFG